MAAETTRRWTAREVRELIAATPLSTPRYELVEGDLLVTPGDERPAVLTETLVWQPVGAAPAFTLEIPLFFASIFET